MKVSLVRRIFHVGFGPIEHEEYRNIVLYPYNIIILLLLALSHFMI